MEHVRWAMPGMLSAMTAAVHEGRSGARASARDDLASHAHERAIEAGSVASDAPRAYAAAASLVSAWGSTALYKIGAWDGRRPLAAEIHDTHKLLESRFSRAAVTETAHAFNETRTHIIAAHADVVDGVEGLSGRTVAALGAGERADAVAERGLRIVPNLPPQGPYRDAPPPPPRPAGRQLRAVKIWSAMLDGHVCPTCRAMHGTVVLARDEFPGGDPPRHPFCRCIPVLLMTAASLDDIERAYEQMAA